MILRSAVRAACLLAGAAAFIPSWVLAQNSPRSARPGELLEEVIVTGSKLKRPDSIAPIPVTSVDEQDIQVSGVTLISDYLRELPVFGINAGRTTETSGADSAKPLSTAGTERLNLRDLGTDRTLVVVDGRRHVGSTAGSTAVDVGSIPTALIERVEISTGGASTAYGADAIAGVVNFIMKKNFEGVQVDTKYGDSDQGGAENTYIALTVGGNFAENRGNAVFSASYNDIGGIRGEQRKYVTDRWGFVPNASDTGPNDGIPSSILRRDTRFTNLITSQGATIGLIDGSLLTFNDDSTSRPFIPGDPASGLVDSVVGGDGVDQVTNSHVATPLQRKSIFGSVNYALTDKVNLFAEGKAYLSDAQVISPPLLDAVTYPENGELFFLHADNPFLSPTDTAIQQQLANNFGLVTMTRWNDDFPLRYADIQRTLNRFIAGVEGDTGFKDWHFEVYGQYGHTNEEYREFNNRDPRRFRLSTDSTTDVTGITGVAPGSPVCRSTLDAFMAGGTTDADILDCKPVNLLGRFNESPESLDYFLIDLLTNKSLEQTVGSASLDGSLFDMPAGPVSFAFGLEYRKETSESIPDAQQQTGQTFTGKTPAVKGSYEVSEAYIETRLPLLKDKPFAELLAIEGGFRASDNSVTGSSSSWRGGGEWAPVRDIRFRGMYSVSVRAPNVGELFTPQAPAISVPEDPCLAVNVGGGPDPARRLANCTALLAPYGLDPRTYVLDPNFVGFAFGGVGGGNPNLKEETATSITYGLVFNPRFLPNLTLSVDFYDIEIEDVIISPTPPSLADGCVDNFDSPDNELCGLVTRDNDPTSFGFGAIKSVNITTRNLAKLSTSGIDFQADYNWRIGPGSLNTRLIANYIDSYKQKQLESAVHEDELVGGPRLPEIRGGLQIGYSTQSLSLNYQIRYIDGVRFAAVEALNPVETTDPYQVGSETISDINASYRFGSGDFNWQLTLGIDNLFEEEPPPGTRTGRFTGGSPYYDPIGRFYYGGLKVSF